ncbi:M2 family metallopeptidase [uncultured Algimonas sp.]|uniref:M2 family metallopeptidase n=1 Tax=uncultured Algimonas sp. TaxID=1547920 RepID=UPI002629F7CE|nr:M2 family metallopeptidase [uncultured Algimonas sp.]
MKRFFLATSCFAALGLGACQDGQIRDAETTTEELTVAATTQVETRPTVQDAREFLEDAEADIVAASEIGARAAWINANFVTEDTNALVAQTSAEGAKLATRLANEAKRFNGVSLPDDMRRKIDMLKRGSNFPAPMRDGAAEELSEIMAGLDATYATGTFAIDTSDPAIVAVLGEVEGDRIDLGQAVRLMAQLRDPALLRQVWEGWRTISPPMRDDYARMVELINEGAQELGYADAGALWRGGYDMDADAFATEVDRLWGQVNPLYEQLHCYVRGALNETYGDDVVPLDAPIRADLLGNMWAQQWGNIYGLAAPEGAGEGVDVTALLEENDYDAMKMVRTADDFFVSMGFDPMPDTFWERSLITKPRDRDVQCHASAWNLDDIEDVRIKMCTEVTGEDFQTVHHEIGHNIYQRAYKDQPVFYKTGANDGFHEAIGDMIALSITPEYLVEIGLLDAADLPGEDADIALLMQTAMNKIAFLPFGLLVDKWRWQVFNGVLEPAQYNDGWWALRTEYQGIRPPSERPADAFDPGAKYHIPGNTPYMRYFLAHVLQFQFHKAACEQAGFEGPLHRCSVYGNEEVGERFNAMLEMGASQPWPDALEAFTGTRDMDGSAILEYYAPLIDYLETQNQGRTCGWNRD